MKSLMLGPKNPMRVVLLMTLVFEAIVCGLAVPVMILVDDVTGWVAALAGGAAALIAVVAAMMMRTPAVGYPLGWLAQLAGVWLGVFTTGMFVVGGLFLILWLISFLLGKRLEEQRR